MRRTVLDMDAYQWTVLLAAWLGWGFDIFDALLFNYVAPNCVPTLLDIPLGTPEASAASLYWTGLVTALMLVGWAVGGIAFGRVADRLGRTRTLLFTMALYSLGTAACAFAPNMGFLVVCRIVASLGIGGEWAAGAAMVAEVVPEKRRVEAGALLYTSAPLGLFLATFVTHTIQGVVLASAPEISWRYVFLCGLVPAAVAFLVRVFVREPERWQRAAAGTAPPRLREIFAPNLRAHTLSGFATALIAMITWWSCNAFIPTVASGLADIEATARHLVGEDQTALRESWKQLATNVFNLGGLLGTLLTIPLSKRLGRRAMYGVYFALGGASILTAFGLDLAPETRLYFYFPIGLWVFGVSGSFSYYLPELFPTRLRGTGAGFCFNAGRVLASGGPFLVGSIAARGADALASALELLFWVGVVPLVGVLLVPFVIETRDLSLED
jgi:MFS family permease